MDVVKRYAQGEGEVSVICDDVSATVARRDWLLQHGHRRGLFVDGPPPNYAMVTAVYHRWVFVKGSLSVLDRDLEVEMDAIEYFNPYSTGTTRLTTS